MIYLYYIIREICSMTDIYIYDCGQGRFLLMFGNVSRILLYISQFLLSYARQRHVPRQTFTIFFGFKEQMLLRSKPCVSCTYTTQLHVTISH